MVGVIETLRHQGLGFRSISGPEGTLKKAHGYTMLWIYGSCHNLKGGPSIKVHIILGKPNYNEMLAYVFRAGTVFRSTHADSRRRNHDMYFVGSRVFLNRPRNMRIPRINMRSVSR